jgi:hypothetical protein
MGLFTRKPVLPDYTGMTVEERMQDPAWYDVVSGVPGFGNATLVANADNGNVMNLGIPGVLHIDAGILTITPECVGYAYSGKPKISQITQPVQKADLSHKGDIFIMMFGNQSNTWTFFSDDHTPFVEGFKQARGYVG